jgi:mono/diheme cytochrome c family protein
MNRVLIGCVVAATAVMAGVGLVGTSWAADKAKPAKTPAAQQAAPAAPAAAAAGAQDNSKPPTDLVKAVPKGKLKNPYQETDADAVKAGQGFLLSYGCSGCHGGGGGGGMCPPLTNDTWVYDGDDDTLFRLVTEGSDELQKNGYMRKGHENVVGPMPPMGTIIKTSDDLWKILVFVRTKYSGDPKYKFGTPESEKAPPSE